MIDNEERISHYLGIYAKDDSIFIQKITKLVEKYAFDNVKSINNYYHDMVCAFASKNINIEEYFVLCFLGDNSFNYNFPLIVKSRPIDAIENILIKLNIARHYGDAEKIIKNKDISWRDKKSIICWRGATTKICNALNKRLILVQKYANYKEKFINIGFNNLVQDELENTKSFQSYIKSYMTIPQMLDNKYLISVEGNDVATNLKWIMASNSIVLMPKPTIESWFFEHKLLPYFHYVPLSDDFSDLEIQYEWCEKNQDMCQQIVANANQHVQNFMDIKNENDIISKIVETYIKKIQFTTNKTKYINKKNVIIKNLLM
jgi:hypothetical protein